MSNKTTLFCNGRFLIQSGSGNETQSSFVDSMVVEGDTITHVGNNIDAPPDSSTTDLSGRLVLPGFIDGHMHLLLLGLSLTKLDLTPCKTLSDIRAMIKDYALATPTAERILCRCWLQSMTNNEALASTLDDLDPRNRPIYIDSKDLHSTWCNTAALAEMGVANIPDPTGGKIHRDDNGKPSGLLSEAATIGFVWPHIAATSSQENRMTAIRHAINAYTRSGYTGIIEMAMDGPAWDALLALRSSLQAEGKPLPIRIAAHWLIMPKSTTEENIAQVDRAISLHKETKSDPDCRIVGIKLITDGVVDGCTAALSEPYSPAHLSHTSGSPLWTPAMLSPVVSHAASHNLQIALHAIGDLAVKNAIDALAAHGGTGLRHRIEHLELTRPEDARRLGERGITASVQPVHADPAILRAWPSLIGADRCKRAFAYKDFVTGGANLAIGSDSPTAPWDPLRNLYTAVTRRSAREVESEEVVYEEQKLSLGTAVAGATKGSAYSCFAEGRVGALKAGLKADFVVLDTSWEQLETGEGFIRGEVLETYFGGSLVYSKATQ